MPQDRLPSGGPAPLPPCHGGAARARSPPGAPASCPHLYFSLTTLTPLLATPPPCPCTLHRLPRPSASFNRPCTAQLSP
eukprot:scaffold8439_cov127-Isochrysis_galbana.AAC.1